MGEPSAAVNRSLENLRSVSSAVSKFIVTWDGLRSLLDSINSSMDSLSAHLDATAGASSQSPHIPSPQEEAAESEKVKNCDTDEDALCEKEEGSGHESKPEDKPEPELKHEHHGTLDIETICRGYKCRKAGKRLRWYIMDRLPSGISHMYNEIPAALARGLDPAVLVLGCLGRFFKIKQGKKLFNPASSFCTHRRAAILALEFFLLSGRAVPPNQLPPAVSHKANTAALAWKERMISEGGVDKAVADDALGLLLLIASFGIPPQFDNNDIANLIQLCNLKKTAPVLRQSPSFVPKVPEIIEDMVKGGKHLAAAELVVAFELQEKFPLLPLLSASLDAIKREREDDQAMKEASEKLLLKLQVLASFLGDHELHKEYASFDLDTFISKLEKGVKNWDETLQNQVAKAKTEETAPLEIIETRSKPLQKLNAKRKIEEAASSDRINPKQSPLRTETISENAIPLNMQDSVSLQRPSMSQPSSVLGPMYTQMDRGPANTSPLNGTYLGVDRSYPVILNREPVPPVDIQKISGAASTSPLNVAYPGTDSRYPGFLSGDPVPSIGNITSGYIGNRLLPVGGTEPYDPYRDSGSNPGSEPYDWYRNGGTRAGVPTARHAFGLPHPDGSSTGEYPGAYLSASQNMKMHIPLPRETGSRTLGSGNRYNFADMV